MYDYVVNSYFKLGPQFDGMLRTKGLHQNDDHFWISPDGQIFHYDTSEAYHWEKILSWAKLPTGKHIKLRPKSFSSFITVEPINFDGPWKNAPEARLHIKNGKVESFIVYRRGDVLCRD